MRSSTISLVATLFSAAVLALVFSRPVIAVDHPGCRDVPDSKDEETCRAESKAKCSSLKPTPRFACEGDIARRFIPCISEDFEKKCTAMESFYKEVCAEPRGIVLSEPKTVVDWKARLDRYVAAGKPWNEFKAKYPECHRYSRYIECSPSADHWASTCEGAPAEYKRVYAGIVDSFLDSDLKYARESIANDLKRESFLVARTSVGMLNETATALLAIDTDIAIVRHRSAELKKAMAELTKLAADVEKAREKALESRRCPKGAAPNPKLLKTLTPVVKGHLTGGETLDETVEVLRMNGKTRLSTEPFKSLTHEDAPMVGCVKQVKKADGAVTCRIFEMTVRRTRVGKGKWGAWAFYSIGGGDEMLCKNIKK